MQLFVNTGERVLCLSFEEPIVVSNLKVKLQDLCGIPCHEQRLISSCRDLKDSQYISQTCFLNLQLRLNGGKGGFGALLRGAGAKAGQKKITNFDDCRDLNGNRIRHKKNEKKMSDWYASAKEREREEEERKQKLREEEAAKNQYSFDPTQYVKNSKEISANIENAVEEVLKASKNKKKEEPKEEDSKKKKRNMMWEEFDNFEEETPTKKKKQENVIHETKESESTKDEEIPIDLDHFSNAEELERIGLEKLKSELMKLGLLCGGTLKQRAQRLFSVKGKSIREIDSKLFAKKKK